MNLCINNKNNSHIKFKSLNNPVKPFTIKTEKDVISFAEIDYTKKPQKNFLKEVAEFFLDNFAFQSGHPYWKALRKNTPEYDDNLYTIHRNVGLIASYKELLKNPDTTLVIGRNKKKEITAAILTEPLKITQEVQNDRTMYLDSIAVNKKYRGNHIGETLVNTVEKSSKDRFDDIFLVAYNESVPFYKKLGFSHIKNKYMIENMAKERLDYPQHASFLAKPIEK